MVSVVIPIYNKSNTLKDCVDSIINQTYRDIEILLIDDGSIDDSWIVCESLLQKDKRIRAFHKENGGVSSARNCGLAHATGDWIVFVDPDDTVDSKYVELMINAINNHSLCVCAIIENRLSGFVKISHLFGNLSIVGYDNVYNQLLLPLIKGGNNEESRLLPPVWNKLYSLSIIRENGIEFDTSLSFAEDYLFNVEYLKHAQSVKFIDEPLYYYNRANGNSLSTSNDYRKKMAASIHVHKKIAKLFPEEGREWLPQVLMRNVQINISAYARYNGISGFGTFCRDMSRLEEIKEITQGPEFQVKGNTLKVFSFLVKHNCRRLFVLWAYFTSCVPFAKHYISCWLLR